MNLGYIIKMDKEPKFDVAPVLYIVLMLTVFLFSMNYSTKKDNIETTIKKHNSIKDADMKFPTISIPTSKGTVFGMDSVRPMPKNTDK